jgi:hypothetical protein
MLLWQLRLPAATIVLGHHGNTGIRLDLQLTGIPTEVGTQQVPTIPAACNHRKWMHRTWYLQNDDVTICVNVTIMQLEGSFKLISHRSKRVTVLLLLRQQSGSDVEVPSI